MMRLYGYWRSSSTWRVRIALRHKGIAYDDRPVHLLREGGEQHSPEYRALNPMEEVPTLELEHQGAGRLRLGQSLAIIQYLEAVKPDPPLLPADPYLRARAWQLAEIVNSGVQPFQNASVLRRIKEDLRGDDLAWVRHFIGRGLRALEALATETAGTFLVGDAVSVADLCLVPQLYGARRFGVDLAPFPVLVRVEAACEALPAFADAHPDRQSDAPRS